jgi:hypothetical protein
MWQGIARASIVFLAVVAALFALTSLSVARSWRLGSVMAGLSGTALVLYGLAVVLMGWEDVGGARGAIPLAVGTCLAGGLGILVGIRGKGERGEAA